MHSFLVKRDASVFLQYLVVVFDLKPQLVRSHCRHRDPSFRKEPIRQHPGEPLESAHLGHLLTPCLQQAARPFTWPHPGQINTSCRLASSVKSRQQPTDPLFSPHFGHFWASALQHFEVPLISPHFVQIKTLCWPEEGFKPLQQPIEPLFRPQAAHFFAPGLQQLALPLRSPHLGQMATS